MNEKKIVKRFYKWVTVDPYYPLMSGGSGMGIKIKKLYYLCSCGKQVHPSRWKKHNH